MSKEPPQEFDPHPGDPWHPDWALEAEAEAVEPSEAVDAEWWRRAMDQSPDKSSLGVPEAYSELTPLPPAPAVPIETEDADTEPTGPDPAPPRDPATVVETVARAFDEELSPVPERRPPDHEDSEPERTVAVAVVADLPDTHESEPVVTIDLRTGKRAGPETVSAPATPVSPTAAEHAPEEDAADRERRAGQAAVRSRESAAELAMIDRLARAEQAAHQESLMWTAVAAAREAEDAAVVAEQDHVIRRAPLDDSWAEDAIAMEEARQRFEESRRRTEAEVRTALERAVAAVPAQDPNQAAAAVAAKFSAIAAQLRLEDAAAAERRGRKEELRLRTSLLVLDAEQFSDAGEWSRPGSSLQVEGAVFASAGDRRPIRIATTSSAAVPESTQRRRWPWSRKRNTPAAPSAPQDSLRSVVVIEERSVSGRADEHGGEQQESLPLDDLDSAAPSPASESASESASETASSPEPAADEPAALDDDLAGWSELDWEMDEAAAAEADASAGGDAAESDDAADETAVGEDEGDDDWADFTAEEYLQTATQEYADLAAAIAAAESEVPEQAAIAADMPGMESSLVGLEDVVAAEGMETADAAPRSDLALRVTTGIALVALFFASLTYRWSIGLLVAIVMTIAAGELATVLVRQGKHPVALFAYLGTLGAILGTWAYGPVAIPFVAAVSVVAIALFFGLVAGREEPLVGMALTVMVVLWVGVFAAFALDIVQAPEYRWLIGGFVVIIAVMDIAQYFVGKRFGKRPLAPRVSPKKTVAGLVGGVIAALAAGYALSVVTVAVATDVGIVLGAALAVTGPIGDLAVSVLKRTLQIKDMGTILPGHGGVLDRIDAILFSLPAAWLVYAWAGVLA